MLPQNIGPAYISPVISLYTSQRSVFLNGFDLILITVYEMPWDPIAHMQYCVSTCKQYCAKVRRGECVCMGDRGPVLRHYNRGGQENGDRLHRSRYATFEDVKQNLRPYASCLLNHSR